ncbi:MAG: DUF1501 domain-containing protein [Cyanobacteria bacterium P01_A01_bin.114]
MKRRRFLKQTALVGASGLISVGSHGWAWRGAAQAADPVQTPRLIVIFLRGAADGLNIVVPYQESRYYEARPTIAIAKPGEPDGVLDLDGQFGLHPALDALMPEWQAGHLAFVHAAGSPVLTRSHFQAQDYMETGTPGEISTPDGWLNRLLAALPGGTPTQAVNIGATLPLIFEGSESVASLAVGGAGSRPLAIDQPQTQTAFDRLYARDDRLSQVYREGRAARDVLLRELNKESMEASRGASAPSRFANSARYLAQLMTGDAATQVAFMELGQWDTHVNERITLNRSLTSLGNGLATLAQALGPIYQNTTVVVLSEFGRTVAENGNGGTEHGYGNVLWMLGGGLRGGKVYGDWPGLDASEPGQSRDLAITTDFRDVLISLLAQQFSLNSAQLAQIFPNHQPQTTLQLV